MKPTIKTTDTIAMTYALMLNDETHRPSFEQKEYGELEWLKLDEEIAWLEKMINFIHKQKEEMQDSQYDLGFYDASLEIQTKLEKRLEQLRGGEE